jgi:CHAT domain-containing protein
LKARSLLPNPLAPRRPSRATVPVLLVLLSTLLAARPGMAQPPEDRAPRPGALTGDDARRVAELEKKEVELRKAGKIPEALAIAREVLAIRRRAQPAGHWEIAEDEQRLRTLERTAALPAATQAEVVAAQRQDEEVRRLYEQGRPAEALRVRERTLETYRRHLGGDDFAVIATTHNLAWLLVELRRPADAEPLAREALRASLRVLGEGQPLTAKCYETLASALTHQGRYAEAAPLIEKALAITRATRGEDDLETATVYTKAGVIRNLRGDLAGAEPLFRKALAIRLLRLGEKHIATAQSYNNVAANLSNRGHNAEAEPLFRKALAICRQVLGEGHRATAQGYKNLGVSLAIQGRYAEAEALVRRALEIYRASLGATHPETASAEMYLARVLTDQGREEEAEPLARRALETRRKTLGDDHPDTADSYHALVVTLAAQDRYAEAEPLARRAVEIRRQRLGDEHPDTAESLNALAAVLQGPEGLAAAEPLLREALKVRRAKLGEEHPHTAQALFNLAMNLAAQESYAEAEPLARQALAIWRAVQGEGHPDTARARAAVADLLHAQGKFAEAAEVGREAVRSSEAARLRVSFAGLGRVRYALRSARPGLVCCLARIGRALEAWQYEEAGLARGLLDEVEARAARPLDAAERRREQDLLGGLDRLDRRLAALPGRGGDQAPADALRRERDGLQAELSRFEAELAERHGVAAGQVYELARVQQHLADDTALVGWLDYAPAPPATAPAPESWAYVVRRTGTPAWVRLPDTEPGGNWMKDDTTKRLRAALARPPDGPDDAAELARRVYTQRLAPLEAALGASGNLPPVHRLIVMPSGWTADVPVEAVTDRYTVSYAPSATLFAWLRERRRADPDPGAATLLAVGDPAFGPAGVAVAARRDGAGTPLPPLPGTRREVEAIAALFARAHKLLGPDASERRLAELAGAGGLQAYRYIHLATHAVVDPRRPLQSALVLAQDRLPDPLEQAAAGGRVSRGRLTAGDVLRTWRLDADLVVLSACDTALGRYSGGEGHLGFAQPLFLAGARGLVLSLWKVDDTATALLMRRFYEDLLGKRAGLERPLPKAEALREAKAWLHGLTADEARRLAEGLLGGGRGTERARPRGAGPDPARPFAHPHYWAAFVLAGDPD